MIYVEGFIVAVPKANRDEYRAHAAKAAPIFLDMGVTRHVEAWANDVPDGNVTDFRKAVQAKEDEDVVFSWFEYPDRATRQSVAAQMKTDPRMEQMGETMPFDGKRIIYGGFEAMLEHGGSTGAYVDGFVLPVPAGNREAYLKDANKMAGKSDSYGALRTVEAWGDDVPDGKVTDFRRAVQARDGETVVFSFIEWPDKAARDAGWARIMADPEMQPDHANMPFDGKRMFWGGFEIIFDTAAEKTPASARELA